MTDQTQTFYQIIQIVITLGSLATAIIIAISKIKQSIKIERLKEEQIKLSESFRISMQSLKDERIKLLDICNSKEYVEKLSSEIDKKNNDCCELREEIKKTKLKLKKNQDTFWTLIHSGVLNQVELRNKTKDFMKYLLLAFDYLIEINLEKVNEYETLKRDGSGLGDNDWKILIDSGLFIKSDDQKYILSIEGKAIFNHYKEYKSEFKKP